MKYVQCLLVKKNKQMVSFIPTNLARVDYVLKLKTRNDSWDDGWVVKEVYKDSERDGVVNLNKISKLHRKATGDDTPKEK